LATADTGRRPRTPTLLLALALACGCGESATRTAEKATPKLDACRLFTYEDAEAIAGESVASMASTLDEAVGRDPSECLYNSGTFEEPRILGLLIRYHRSPQAAKRLQESSRSSFKALSGGQVREILDLGDGALWVGGRIQQLHVVVGEKQLVITVHSPDGTEQLPKARQIAGKVLERMQAGG
jgi:hypothetical protein